MPLNLSQLRSDLENVVQSRTGRRVLNLDIDLQPERVVLLHELGHAVYDRAIDIGAYLDGPRRIAQDHLAGYRTNAVHRTVEVCSDFALHEFEAEERLVLEP